MAAETSGAPRSLRADARDNQRRVLEAAARAFAREGQAATMNAIARDAGVGVATLYRRFATREALVEAVYRAETLRLADSAERLVRRSADPRRALAAWCEGFVDYVQTKDGMAEALPRILTEDEGLRTESRERLRAALALLLDSGVRAGAFRDDLEPHDVLMAIGGITLISRHEAERTLATRLIGLLLDGLSASRPNGADSPRDRRA